MHRYWFAPLALLGLMVGLAAEEPQREQPREQSPSQGPTSKVSLGVVLEPAEEEEGVRVRQVVPNSPAAKAGVRPGDVITKIDNREVDDYDTLTNVLAGHKAGDRVQIRVRRDGQDRNLAVTLGATQRQPSSGYYEDSDRREGAKPGARTDRPERGQTQGGGFLGVQAVSLDELGDRLKKRLGISGQDGVVVLEVVPGSPAARAGLRHGDVITKVNDKEINNPQDLRSALRQAGVGKQVTLDVQRGDQEESLTARLEAAPVDLFPNLPLAPGMMQEGMRYGAEAQQRIEQMQRRIEQLENRIRQLEKKGTDTPKKSDQGEEKKDG